MSTVPLLQMGKDRWGNEGERRLVLKRIGLSFIVQLGGCLFYQHAYPLGGNTTALQFKSTSVSISLPISLSLPPSVSLSPLLSQIKIEQVGLNLSLAHDKTAHCSNETFQVSPLSEKLV